jgi:hypothetical protein
MRRKEIHGEGYGMGEAAAFEAGGAAHAAGTPLPRPP